MRLPRARKAPHWHDDVSIEYLGPARQVGHMPLDLIHPLFGPPASGDAITAAPRVFRGGEFEEYRDSFRVVMRAAFEAQLLARQRLFRLVDRERRTVSPSDIDFKNYHPLLRPSLPELLASYGYHLKLGYEELYEK